MGSIEGSASNNTRIEYVGSPRGKDGTVGGVTGVVSLERAVVTIIDMPVGPIVEG
jgi:hypothetical protein